MIGIIDYGLGNPASIQNMLKKIGQNSIITSDLFLLDTMNSYILPGVGNFKNGKDNLDNLGLTDYIKNNIRLSQKPLLGICLGMQLLTGHSEEGDSEGLGIIEGNVIMFDKSKHSNLKIPHMGWNYIKYSNNIKNKDLDESELERYYFVHSYHVTNIKSENVIANTNYAYDFPSIIKKANFLGVQFHPEKSHRYGMDFLNKIFLNNRNEEI
jgi:glutamine amidotransferase